ncbi:hypothetical protein A33Q_3673 [Indibacter alkaliphilus LW1]|uniref:DinB-like domain-containing protein n=1 Tax=Indibacter alkaliphilus (strain CCUG 57479 / KCTC 22604 / LW1) TaxID=1189612 RepID=S2D350_INDAL|nr:putative metal-dependent hydrolase [Indibacter alkaliphilus]EOZ93727.1 hypothetical protein A33Q_3673 [Indibacter alkaliphilus LW1]
MTTDLKYPIGKFQAPTSFSIVEIQQWIQDIKAFPAQVKAEVFRLGAAGLEKPYREGGWTGRQVIHHCADSHYNSFMRFKLALTEEIPSIKPYHEDLWAKQVDYDIPIDASMAILEGLHIRWTTLLESLSLEDMQRTFYHPEMKREIRLDHNIALYSWHCRHHLGQLNLIIP